MALATISWKFKITLRGQEPAREPRKTNRLEDAACCENFKVPVTTIERLVLGVTRVVLLHTFRESSE
eukprot:3164183-Amphidinium_carterae.1